MTTAADIIAALQAEGGDVQRACDRLGFYQGYIYAWVRRRPQHKAAIYACIVPRPRSPGITPRQRQIVRLLRQLDSVRLTAERLGVRVTSIYMAGEYCPAIRREIERIKLLRHPPITQHQAQEAYDKYGSLEKASKALRVSRPYLSKVLTGRSKRNA